MSAELRGCVIVPAHNEAAMIGRTLGPLSRLAQRGLIEVIVAANGCTDDTAARARRFAGIQVLDVETASKAAALNAADDAATAWPRLYLDADIAVPADTVLAVLDRLAEQDVLAARPSASYISAGSDWLVSAYYRARRRMPVMREHLWGAGAYGLSQAGHARVGEFPEVIADDLYVDGAFAPQERLVVPTKPVLVRCPRTARALLGTLRRVYAGSEEISEITATPTAVGGLGSLSRTVSDLGSLFDAVVYSGFALAGRLGARRGRGTWHRDETNRTSSPEWADGADLSAVGRR